MILHDVANGADFLVEAAPALHAELLGHRDLDVLDVISVPDRLEEGVGETEIQQVLHRLLAEVMIDAKDRRFGEHLVQRLIERLRARQVAAEGLLDDDARVLRASGLRRGPARRCRTGSGGSPGSGSAGRAKPELVLQLRDRCPGRRSRRRHSAAAPTSLSKHSGFEIAGGLHAVACALAQLVERPAGARHADDGNVERSPVHHGVSAGKIFLYARSPVAPKNTKASDSIGLSSALCSRVRGAAVRVPPAAPTPGRRRAD